MLRSLRERVIQTLAYEAGGLLLVTPAYALMFGHGTGESLFLLAVLSAAVMIWSPLHNTLFDWLDLRLSGRVASDRPPVWRCVHVVSHELSSIILTLPLIMWIGGHGFWQAMAVDIGLTIYYACYAYLFHVVFDRLRPVRVERIQP